MSTKPEQSDPTDPYCRNCGYSLFGLVDSSKCPECGKPLVEVLVRDAFIGKTGRRYESKRRLFGLPLVAIASGPYRDEKRGRPIGIVAIGDYPIGVIALGNVSFGVISWGAVSIGLLAGGGLAIGGVAFGGGALGVLAYGGMAAGLYAIGGLVIPFLKGWGGVVIRPW